MRPRLPRLGFETIVPKVRDRADQPSGKSEPIDATMLTDPVPNLHVVGMGILGESGGFGLFGCEEALLLVGHRKEPVWAKNSIILKIETAGFQQTCLNCAGQR